MTAGSAISRRKLVLTLPALAALGASASDKKVLPSNVFLIKDLKTNSHPGYTGREMFNGDTHEGYHLEVHESQLEPGAMPHPPHQHKHEEMFMMREGTLEVTISGKSSKIGPGDTVYIASNELHGVKNTGKTPAQYFVVEIGTNN